MNGERHLYALTDWTVEKRAGGWYFGRSATPSQDERLARADLRSEV